MLAGATGQHFTLARIQLRPDRVIGAAVIAPRLLHHAGGVDRHVALVGDLVFQTLRAIGGPLGNRVDFNVPLKPRKLLCCVK